MKHFATSVNNTQFSAFISLQLRASPAALMGGFVSGETNAPVLTVKMSHIVTIVSLVTNCNEFQDSPDRIAKTGRAQ